ncbi:response regulator [candidate division KSB3 bacterium]|uniref:histidine kinase n=1 Tax=candidate division KSB3 bacterium TaxID=2044937 RepID=A0A9D5JU94_9BACT|nr:response regulator [candidate division KSB3 bacterium]MBD3324096.1 response regulator [candidate division KSB3 bacterium]
MSHEFRTPLNTILGMAEILQEEVYGTLHPEQHDAVRNIEESGRHLLSLVTDILDLSKIGAGKLNVDITPVYVETVCKASLRFIKQIALKKRLKFSCAPDPQVTRLSTDERRLKQILVNLLTNAVKFTPEGGKIGIEIAGNAEQHIVHFIVWDTGVGIAQTDLARVFQPFVQVDGTLARKHAGAGLGLSLTARMIEMLGGGLTVESAVGQGSRFRVSLPWNEENHEVAEGAFPPAFIALPSDKSTERLPKISKEPAPLILIVDHHEPNIPPLSEYLTAVGYRVAVAWNGKETLACLRAEPPALIVMDDQVPELDSLEMIQRLHSDSRRPPIPIIVVTALTLSGDRERYMAAGAAAYMTKPVNLRTLVQRIEALIATSRRSGSEEVTMAGERMLTNDPKRAM